MRTQFRRWLRHRLSSEDGLTLVEMLVALIVITIALFALLGTLIASATSLADQRSRAAATRVATEHLESIRQAGFDALHVGDEIARVEKDGRWFERTTVVKWMDADDPENGVGEDVKHVTVTVSWTFKGQAKSTTFTTAVAPEHVPVQEGAGAGGAEKQIKSVNFSPSSVMVDDDGANVEEVSVLVALEGFPRTTLVLVTWTNEDGTDKRRYLTSRDPQGTNWGGTIPVGDIVKKIPTGEESTTIDLNVQVEDLERGFTVTLVPEIDREEDPAAVTFDSAEVEPVRIRVKEGKGNDGDKCNQPDACTTLHDVVFTARVHDPENRVRTMIVQYQVASGNFAELSLEYDPAGKKWTATLPAGTAKLKPGTNQPFEFVALQTDNRPNVTTVVLRTVEAVAE
jgi:type II secretory pathway pseudopilin PulG